jgi:NADH:ubiquinone oxidoreductase subunit 5 (subunit L)/multisubunit Na+/H+ antiporter MnhA subunit
MTLVVTGVGALIHVFAIGYMHGDERFARFFTYLNLFTASMLTLVLAGNYAMLPIRSTAAMTGRSCGWSGSTGAGCG